MQASCTYAQHEIWLYRLLWYQNEDLKLIEDKGDYVVKCLPEEVIPVGQKADGVSYWLFPLLVENANEVTNVLNKLGVESTKNSSQLKVVHDSNYDSDFQRCSKCVCCTDST
ncbi:unnamed protein product [Clavelina lepadiformis]|uniref:Uncharacterized protein n=1 Tax=Clavelina lepadiformis TaxID=159417 RepID=A0ABP0H404_CLALP